LGRWTLPERKHLVQTLTLLTSPSTKALTRWMLGFQVRLVFKWEWLTLNPVLTPLLQTEQIAIYYTSSRRTKLFSLSNKPSK
jgi:hypothetical protein